MEYTFTQTSIVQFYNIISRHFHTMLVHALARKPFLPLLLFFDRCNTS